MNPQKLLILVLVLLAATATLVYVNSLPESVEEQEDAYDREMRALNTSAVAAGKETVFQGDANELVHISLHRSLDMAIVKLVPGANQAWYVQEPYQDRAENGIVLILANLLFDTEALPSPDAWQDFTDKDLGLDQPSHDIEVLYRDGSEERLQIGARVPNSSHFFARLEGKLIQIPSQIRELAHREAMHWRDHSLVQWPQLSQKVSWQSKDGQSWTIERNNSTWNLIEPIQGAVDPLRVQTFMRLLGARASSLPQSLAQADEIEQFKNQAGVLTVQGMTGDKTELVQTFWLAGNYALDEERGFFLALGVDDVRFLGLDVEKMRSKRLVAFDPNHISSLRLLMDGKEFVLMRGTTGWKDDQGRSLTRAANNKLTTLLRYLSILETQELVRPSGTADVHSILLSKARKPVVRGSVQLRYSLLPDGRSAVSALGSRQSYAADRNLDEEWDKVLQFVNE